MPRNIENDFNQGDITSDQRTKMDMIRKKAKELAYTIYRLVPGSREQSSALSRLDEALFWANAGVLRNPNPPQKEEDNHGQNNG